MSDTFYAARPDDRLASVLSLAKSMILGLLDSDEPTPAERLTLERLDDELKYGPRWALFAGNSRLPLVGGKAMVVAAARALNFARTCDRKGELRRLAAELESGNADVLRDIEDAMGVDPDDDDDDDFDSDLDDDAARRADPDATPVHTPEPVEQYRAPLVVKGHECYTGDPYYMVGADGKVLDWRTAEALNGRR